MSLRIVTSPFLELSLMNQICCSANPNTDTFKMRNVFGNRPSEGLASQVKNHGCGFSTLAPGCMKRCVSIRFPETRGWVAAFSPPGRWNDSEGRTSPGGLLFIHITISVRHSLAFGVRTEFFHPFYEWSGF